MVRPLVVTNEMRGRGLTFDWSERSVRHYLSFADAVDKAETNPITLVVDDVEDVAANLTVPANVRLQFLSGGRLRIAAGVTVTVGSPEHIEADGRKHIIEGAGAIAFTRAGVVYPGWWGAVGDGVTDSTAAFQAALAALPAAGVLHIPIGAFLISAALTRATAITIEGEGDGSVLVPAIGPGTDLLTVGDAAAGTYYSRLCDFAVLNNVADTCRDAIVMQRTYYGAVDRVTVSCGHAGFALRLRGTTGLTSQRFRTGYSSAPMAYTRGVSGVCLEDLVVQCNKVRFSDIFLNLHSGYGIYCTSAIAANTIEIDGTIQNITGNPVYLSGVRVVKVDNLYLEACTGDFYASDVQDLTLGPDFKFYAAGDVVDLVNCQGVQIEGWIRDLNIDADCRAVKLGMVSLFGTITDNSGKATAYDGPTRFSTHYFGVGDDPQNLIYNGAFRRWQSDRPDGWGKSAATTWTQCGTGLGDTTRHATTYCAKAVTTSYTANALTLPNLADVIARVAGQAAAFGIWFKTSGSPTNWPQIRIRLVRPGPVNVDYYTPVISTPDEWVYRELSFDVPSDVTDIQIALYVYGTIYMAEPVFRGGLLATRGYVDPIGDCDLFAMVSGQKIAFGSAAPASGYYKQGDIVFNTGASASGKVGWVCVTAGSPGTWKPFGAIDA